MMRFLMSQYSVKVHSLLLMWNSLAAFYVGSADFRNQVAGLQHTLHLPASTLALLTGLINITVTYRNWQKPR